MIATDAQSPGDYLEVTVRDGLADLVTVLCVVRRTDGTQHNCGLLSFTSEEWHHWVKPGYLTQPRVRMQDASSRTPRQRFGRDAAYTEDRRVR